MTGLYDGYWALRGQHPGWEISVLNFFASGATYWGAAFFWSLDRLGFTGRRAMVAGLPLAGAASLEFLPLIRFRF